ncbi:MAG: hypothetical protein U0441_18335 [Polyangiaceae bacterium]
MTEDPVRLLSKKGDDAFAASLLRSARDGDRDDARAHKALVLGAGGAAIGGAALAATKLSSRGVFSWLGTKGFLAVIATLGGLGIGAALLWPDSAPPSAPDARTAAADVPMKTASPPSPARDTAPDATSEPPSKQALSDAPAPADGPSAANAEAAGGDAAPARPSTSAAPPAQEVAPSPATARDAKPTASTEAAANAANNAAPASTAAPASGGAAGLAEEVAALRAAHEALGKGDSARCLAAVSAYFAAFPNGRLSAEARVLRIEALFAGGKRAEAAALAKSMLAASPRSPYAARLRTIAGDDAP